MASYNVLYALAEDDGRVDTETLERATSVEADVLLLQETNAVWEKALRPRLSRQFAHCAFHHPKRLLPEGLAICVKGRLLEQELVPSPVGWFPAQRAIAETGVGKVQLLNLHLKPAVADPPEWVATHLRTRVDRAREVRELVGPLRTDLPTIVGGDMNEQPDGELFAHLAQVGFENALPRAGVRDATWTWAGARPPLDFQLDHLAYGKQQLELESAVVLEGGRSDHKAVVATFRAPQR
ncbi:MAG: endonuclease/exonuclease/phosphatase family protein [Myxococcales bacterium]|nr:endonuclease/exonuclease/phosphatase family protein [Myxococcales bacterium]